MGEKRRQKGTRVKAWPEPNFPAYNDHYLICQHLAEHSKIWKPRNYFLVTYKNQIFVSRDQLWTSQPSRKEEKTKLWWPDNYTLDIKYSIFINVPRMNLAGMVNSIFYLINN